MFRFVFEINKCPYQINYKVKKYLTLISLVLIINTAKPQSRDKFDPKFIYEKLVDIYHKSLTVDPEEYFSQFGYDLVSDKDLPDGNIVHRAVPDAGVNHLTLTNQELINGWGNRELSFTTHSISKNLYSTVESRYSTNSRKEYNELLNYILKYGYRLISDVKTTEKQTYQIDKMQVVFEKIKSDDPKPYKVIYSVTPN